MLTDKRTNLKPFEYPELVRFAKAIQQAYWLVEEFNYTEDVQDYHTRLSGAEKEAIKRTMLAISQIEVAVKTFWGEIHKWFPKPEVAMVGFTFADSEVRHSMTYSHLLDLLGLNHEFQHLLEVPAIASRVDYLHKHRNSPTDSYKDYVAKLALFSLFVENVSLFSQFLIMKAFWREKNMLKGVGNAVDATAQEEQLHGNFGIELINILKSEKPELFGDTWAEDIMAACYKAYEAEAKILDWIFEQGELEFLPLEVIKTFLKQRFNASLRGIGLPELFSDLPSSHLDKVRWFDEEMLASKHVDFFSKRSVAYARATKSITEDDLF